MSVYYFRKDYIAEEEQKKQWDEVENLVLEYQKQFDKTATPEQIEASKKAAEELLQRFNPLFKKYIMLLQTGQIDFSDPDVKRFVLSFIDEPALKRALRRNKQRSEYRAKIYKKFNFIKETYGALSADEMLTDFNLILLQMARRYKNVGRTFCVYVYNGFRYEVARLIKKFIRNPLNVYYKQIEYEDFVQYNTESKKTEDCIEDTYYENAMGIPDLTWFSGESCTDLFYDLTPFERKLLVKYYLEEWNDRQIAEEFGTHINTINQKRRQAVNKLAAKLGIPPSEIKRNRRSGKKATMPLKAV